MWALSERMVTMLNPLKLAVVKYPNGAVKLRSCQTTVAPNANDLGPVTSFNDWQLYLRFRNDAAYNASHAFDTIMGIENTLCEAQEILVKTL